MIDDVRGVVRVEDELAQTSDLVITFAGRVTYVRPVASQMPALLAELDDTY